MNSKTTINSQLSTTEPKKRKQKLSKQLEQERNQRNGDHMEGFHWGSGRGRVGKKLQGIISITGRHKIDGERLRMEQETENSKNLHGQPMNMN